MGNDQMEKKGREVGRKINKEDSEEDFLGVHALSSWLNEPESMK